MESRGNTAKPAEDGLSDTLAISERTGPRGVRGVAPPEVNCPIESAMGVIGSRAAMLIMREAFYGTSRFDEFVRRVDVAPATASAHLRALTEAGLLKRQSYREPKGRPRDEYALTEAGIDLMPVIFGLFDWGRHHTDVQPRIALAHAGCGAGIEVHVRCAEGHKVTRDEIEWLPAPHHPNPAPTTP